MKDAELTGHIPMIVADTLLRCIVSCDYEGAPVAGHTRVTMPSTAWQLIYDYVVQRYPVGMLASSPAQRALLPSAAGDGVAYGVEYIRVVNESSFFDSMFRIMQLSAIELRPCRGNQPGSAIILVGGEDIRERLEITPGDVLVWPCEGNWAQRRHDKRGWPAVFSAEEFDKRMLPTLMNPRDPLIDSVIMGAFEGSRVESKGQDKQTGIADLKKCHSGNPMDPDDTQPLD